MYMSRWDNGVLSTGPNWMDRGPPVGNHSPLRAKTKTMNNPRPTAKGNELTGRYHLERVGAKKSEQEHRSKHVLGSDPMVGRDFDALGLSPLDEVLDGDAEDKWRGGVWRREL